MKRNVKVEFKKLGRNKALGLAYKSENKIVLDPRLKGKDFIEIALHELLHLYFPYIIEEDIDNAATEMTQILSDLGVIKSEKNSKMIQ